MTFKKVRWALRFPLPPTFKRSQCPPFFFHSRFPTGPSQWIRFFCRTRTSSSFPASNASMAKSHVMSTPIPLMNTLFVGYAPRLPGSLNVMKGTNQLSLPASSPFSVALSLYLRLLNLSRLETAMTTRLSNSCVPSFATTRWSCAFLGSRTPSMLCKLNRHWPAGLSPLQLRPLHISPPCPRVSNLTLPLLRNSINLPRQEGRLRRDQLQLRPPQRQKAPLLALFLLHTLANPHPARLTPLLQPIVDLPARPSGHTLHILIKELLLLPVKARAQTQGKAKALVPPTPR